MDAELKASVVNLLSEYFHKPVQLFSTSAISGGCINESAKLQTSVGVFFIKWNKKDNLPDLFEKEIFGLEKIAKTRCIATPEIIISGSTKEAAFLILRFIESYKPTEDFWINFGKQLAQLHQSSNDNFGLDHSNYIGSLPQSNSCHSKWPEFYILERLEPQIRLARDKKLIGQEEVNLFSKFFTKLEHLIPIEKPALIHGDLWSGNFLVNGNQPVLIDPAVYYGHREMDLAMTTLFGGFSPGFYKTYEDWFPLEKGWQQRLPFHQLYPLLVHLNLFGSGYLSDIKNILKKI